MFEFPGDPDSAKEDASAVAEAGPAVLSGSDFADSIGRMVGLAVPRFADACLIDVMGSELRCVYAVHTLAEKHEFLHGEIDRSPRPGSPRGRVARSSLPVLVPEVGEEEILSIARDEAHLSGLRRLGMQSVLSLPLFVRDAQFGVITFLITEGQRRFDESALEWALQFGRHVGRFAREALENAEEKRLREKAERAADRMKRVQEIASALSRAPGQQQIAMVVLRHGAEALGAEAGLLAQLAADGITLEVILAIGMPQLPAGKIISIQAPLPPGEAVRTRAPVVIATPEEILRRFPLFEKVATVRAGGLAAVPLIVDGQVIGALQLCFAEGRHPRNLDSHFLTTVAELAAQALARARLLDEARRAEERFRSLTEVAPLLVWIEGKDGKLEYSNGRLLEYIGLSPEEARSADVSALRARITHPDDLARSVVESVDARRAGRVIESQVRLRRADGVYRRHLNRAAPIYDADGTIARWVGTATDVEALAQAETELEEREAYFRYLTESVILGVGFFGIDGTVTEMNSAARTITGYTEEDVAQGRVNWRAITPPEYWPRDDAAVAEMMQNGFCVPYEKEYLRKDGQRVPILVGAALLSGSRFAGVGFTVDLSERKRIEREHAALVGAEQTFRERLLGIVGHDLRNPLAAIDSWARILKRSPSLSPRDQTAIERIGRSVERMRRMIAQLLDLTRTRQNGGIPLERHEVDLRSICREVIDELAPADPGRFRFEAEGDLVGHWDRDRLGQVVSNLASNAIEHGDGGAITIVATGEAEHVRLEVHNGGPAIAEAELPHLFDPYRRGRLSSLEPTGGLGFGLYIVQQIVVAHGGEITPRSTADEGTTFVVRLPR